MKISKARFILMAGLLYTSQMQAQLKFPVTNNGLRTDLEKVISDFPHQFSSIKGDVMISNPQSIEYASLVNFSGAEQSSITEYSAKQPIYSWQATMLSSEDFTEAAKKYKWLCSQLKVMTVKLKDYSFSLSGTYEEADESRKFCSSVYHLLPAATNLGKLKIEVAMNFEFPEWKVSLSVYQKEREDNERGKEEDGK